jgi:hypothetical protein
MRSLRRLLPPASPTTPLRGLLLALALAAPLVACGKKKDEGPSAAASASAKADPLASASALPAGTYPETTEGLAQLLGDFLAGAMPKDAAQADRARSVLKSLHLPGDEAAQTAFFKRVWGDDAGARLAAEYKQHEPEMLFLQKLFFRLAKEGAVVLEVHKAEKADDQEINGYEAEGLSAMKQPIPLYSARLGKKGQQHGAYLWSFAYVDGGFRLIGRLTRAKDGPAPDKQTDALMQLRKREAKSFLETGKVPKD